MKQLLTRYQIFMYVSGKRKVKGRVNPATMTKPEFCIFFFHHFKQEYVSYHYHHKKFTVGKLRGQTFPV